MNILFLGTGAADWPEKNTDNAAEFRRMSSAIIDRTLLIDPGPQVLDALTEQGISFNSVKYIINTHPHSDHFNQNTLRVLQNAGAEFFDLKPNDVTTFGKYTVYAYSGNHSTCEKCVHFIITDNEKTVFYGLDGAWLMYDEVAGIKEHKPDLAVLDATIGFIDGDYRIFEHNNLNMVLEMQKTLAPYIGKICISHLAKTLHDDCKTVAKNMEKYGILTAYDGFNITL